MTDFLPGDNPNNVLLFYFDRKEYLRFQGIRGFSRTV
jgi:hypothetical protein